MRAVIFFLAVWTSFPVGSFSAEAEKADPAWGEYAGTHLGNAEAASSCKGMKLNQARRSEIEAIVSKAGLTGPFEAKRTKQREGRLRAIKKDPAVCETLVKGYGPKGLIARHYVLPAGSPDLPNTPGPERAIELGIDPRGIEGMQWSMQAVAAALVVTKCPGYEVEPLAQGYFSLYGAPESTRHCSWFRP